MRRNFVRLSLALALACVMALGVGAAPAAQSDRRLEMTVQDKGAPLGDVEVLFAAANNPTKSIGRTDRQGNLTFNFDDVANIGTVKAQVIADECPDGRRVYLVGPDGQLPPARDKCQRRVIGTFWWNRATRVVVNVSGGLSVSGGGLSMAAKVAIGAAAAGGAAAAALAAGGTGSTPSTPIATTPPPATPSPAPPPPDVSRFTAPPPFNTTSTVTSFTDPKCSREVGFSFMNPGQFTANPDGSNAAYNKDGFLIGPPGTINPVTGAFSTSMASPRSINFPGLPPMQQVTMQFNGNFAQDGRSFEGTLTVNINAGPAANCNGQRQILNVRGGR